MKRRSIAILCIASLVFVQACATEDTSTRTPMTGGEIAEEAGLGLGSFLASVVYAPLKVVYATGGLVAGGLAWAFSGGDGDVAMRVIEPAVSGDYVITPDRLRDPASIEFIGRGSSSPGTSIAARPAPTRTSSAPPAVSAPPPGPRVESVSAADILETSSCSQTVTLQPIGFAHGGDTLDAEGRRQLEGIPAALNRCPGSTVRIVGHADATGPSPYNMELSKLRAKAIRDHLIGEGVEASRLEIVAAGEAKPASSNDTSAGRAFNRRAEVALVAR